MTPTRITLPGVLAVVMIGVSDLAYASLTPCSLTLAPEFHAVPVTLGGCGFGMQVAGLLVASVGALTGFGLGWVITNGPMGRR